MSPDSMTFDFNKVYVRGRLYHFTPSMVAMLETVYKRYPDLATHEEITSAIWGRTEDGPPLTYLNILQHYAHMIRRILQDHIRLVAEYHRGYRMEWVEQSTNQVG